MKITIDVEDVKWSAAVQKAVAEGGDAVANLTQIAMAYCEACARDVGAAVEAKIAEKVAAAGPEGKAAILAAAIAVVPDQP